MRAAPAAAAPARERPAAADLGPLSKREAAVLRLIALGYGFKDIARRLAISVKTAETFKARAVKKLGLKSRVDIVGYAAQRGWLGPD